MPSPPSQPSPIVGAASFVLLMAMVWSWVWVISWLRRGLPLLPRHEARPVPWGAGSIVLVVLAYLLIEMIAGAGYFLVARPKRPDVPPEALLVLAAIRNAAMLAVVPLILRLTSKASLTDLGLGPAPIVRNVARGIVACLLFLPIVYGLGAVVVRIWDYQKHPLEEMVRADPSGRIALIAIVSAVLVAPATEEVLFRGVLQGWLARLFGGWPDRSHGSIEVWIDTEADATAVVVDAIDPPLERASVWAPPRASLSPPVVPKLGPQSGTGWARAIPNVVASAIFAAIHVAQWPAPIPLFFLALGLGALYQRTGSLIAPITMHAAFNGLSTLALFARLST